MSEKQKKERKIVKIGTHGRTLGSRDARALPYGDGNPDLSKKKATLAETDKQEWKARKAKRQARKDQARAAAKKLGYKLGRWQGSVALVKDEPFCATIGSPVKSLPKGYSVFEGGAR